MCANEVEIKEKQKLPQIKKFTTIYLPYASAGIYRNRVTAPVVQKVDNAIHWLTLYPVDKAIGFPNTYPLDSDLSGEFIGLSNV